MTVPNHRGEISVSSLTVDEAVSFAITEAALGPDGQRIPIKQVAALANIPISVLYDIASGRRPARANELALIVRATGCVAPVDAVERDICRVGVPLPDVTHEGDPVIERAAKACREFGEFMAALGAAAENEKYCVRKTRNVRGEAEQVIAAILSALHQIESDTRVSTKGQVA